MLKIREACISTHHAPNQENNEANDFTNSLILSNFAVSLRISNIEIRSMDGNNRLIHNLIIFE